MILLLITEGGGLATEGDGDRNNEDTLGALMALLTWVVTLLTLVVLTFTVVVVTLDTVVVEGVVMGVLDMFKMI